MPSGSKSNTPASNTMVRDIGEKVGVEKTVDNPPRDEGNGGLEEMFVNACVNCVNCASAASNVSVAFSVDDKRKSVNA